MITKQHLTQLETTGLIRLIQTHPEFEYLFRHALVQDAAYESLLLSDRKKLHRQVAETLERLYPDRLDELAAVLGHHFAVAGDNHRALKYFTLAGNVSFGMNANAEAEQHYSRALNIALDQPELLIDQLVHLFTRRGRSLELLGRFDEAKANYQKMEILAAERGDRVLELAGLMAQVTIYAIPSSTFDPEQGRILSGQALALAQTLGDKAAEAKILWNIMLLHFFTDNFQQGLEFGEQSLALARAFALKEQLAYTLNDLAGYCYLPGGQYEQGQAALSEARAIWQELDNQPMLADNLTTSAFNYFLIGDFAQAHRLSSQAYQINQTIANLWGQAYSRLITGLYRMERGQSQQAIHAFEETIPLAEQAGFMPGQVIAGGMLAIQYGLLGDFDRALELARQAVALADSQIGFWRPHALGSLALVYLRLGNLAAAAEIMQQFNVETVDPSRFIISYIMAMLADCELGLAQKEYGRVIAASNKFLADLRLRQTYTYLPYLLYYRAQALLGQNQPEQANEALTEARALADKLDSKNILWPVLASLEKIEPEAAQAKHLHRQAQEIIEYIANQISAKELRVSFLNLPDVRAVMAKHS